MRSPNPSSPHSNSIEQNIMTRNLPSPFVRFAALLAGAVLCALSASSASSAPPAAVEVSLESVRELHPRRIEIPVRDVSKWNIGFVGTGTEGRVDPVQNADSATFNISFREDGKKSSFWAYPRIGVPRSNKGDDLEGAEGIVVRARVFQPGTVRAFLWKRGDVGYLTQEPLMPGDGEWHTVFFPIDRMIYSESGSRNADPDSKTDLTHLVAVSFGVNSQQATNSFEISDFYIVWPRE